MPKDYVPPQHAHDGFNCPNPDCEAYTGQKWYFDIAGFNKHNIDPSNFKIWFNNLSLAVCDKCHKPSIWVDGKLVFPESYGAPAPSPDMSDEIKADYEEAQAIVSNSPRGAAALLRLVIQKLVVALGEDGKDLNKNIGNLVRKGLPIQVQQALDTVRVIGNNAVHPGQIDVNDNPKIALGLFGFVNVIVEQMITQPKKIEELYTSALPEGAKDQIEDRDKPE